MAATDSGEAQTVPRPTKRGLDISRETCCDSVKKHRANRVPFEKRQARFTDRATTGLPVECPRKNVAIGASSWFSLIIALVKAFLLFHSILYQNK